MSGKFFSSSSDHDIGKQIGESAKMYRDIDDIGSGLGDPQNWGRGIHDIGSGLGNPQKGIERKLRK